MRIVAAPVRHARRARGGGFPAAVLESIEAAIAAAEARTSGEIRFVVETALEPAEVWAGLAPRAARHADLLGPAHVEHRRSQRRTHLCIAGRPDVEIVADRGAAERIGQADWEGVCRLMEGHFRDGRFAEGAVAGVAAVGGLLARHFPPPRAQS